MNSKHHLLPIKSRKKALTGLEGNSKKTERVYIES